jgi:hypothetical protein
MLPSDAADRREALHGRSQGAASQPDRVVIPEEEPMLTLGTATRRAPFAS